MTNQKDDKKQNQGKKMEHYKGKEQAPDPKREQELNDEELEKVSGGGKADGSYATG